MKEQRYYEIVDGIAYIYDSPYSKHSLSVSIVTVRDLAYYRANFQLGPVWKS